MRRVGLRLALATVVALCVVVPINDVASARASSPGTTVSVDGTTVTITVHIDVFLGDPGDTAADPENVRLSQEYARDIERYWNAGFAKFRYRGCLTLKLVVDIHTLPPSEYGTRPISITEHEIIGEPGYHAIVYSQFDNVRPVYYDVSQLAGATGDYLAPYQHESFGYWSDDLQTPRDFAHEVGHMMGLQDDYDRLPNGDFEAHQGREGTLMGGGDAIDQSLVDRLGDLVAKTGTKLPTCWSGTIHSTSTQVWHQYGASLRCTEIWNLSLGFTTDKDGIITGSGTGAFDHLQNCHASFPWDFTNASTMAFDVTGKLMTDSVELQLVETAIDGQTQGLLNYTLVVSQTATLDVPITSPGVAEGTVTIHASAENGARATGVHVVHLECQGCAAA